MNTTRLTHLGIDIAKHKFDVALLIDSSIHRATFSNSTSGHAALLKWLEERKAGQVRICMEATGRYSWPLALFLYERKLPVSVVNPMAVYHFARSNMSRTKTDRHDALLIARFCQEKKLRLWQPPTRERQQLLELVRVREQLIDNRVKVSLQQADAPASVCRFFERQIRFLTRQIEQVEAQIDQWVKANAGLRQAVELIESIPGIGRITAVTVLSLAPPIEQLTSARQLAAFAGVTPRQDESGTARGPSRLCKLGHGRLRKALYFPAIVARRSNPIVRALAERLTKKGKAKMSVIGACMRQLLHLIYGVLKTNQPFDPNYQQARSEVKAVAGGAQPQLAPATVETA